MPSSWPEPFGRGVIEAAARGRASLVSRSGGVAGLVDDGVTGWTAEATPDGLAAGFRRAADHDDQVAFGRSARARFETHYTREASLTILDRELTALARAGLDL